MQNSKLIQLLQTFSTAEWRSFQDFVHSPYYNKHEDTARLSDYLKEGAPDLREDYIERPLVYRNLFPGEAYDERRLNRLMSKLLKLAEQFLGIQRFESAGILPDCYTLEALVDRQLEKSFDHQYRQARERLESGTIRDDHYHFQKYLLADIAFRRVWSRRLRTSDPNLQEAGDQLQQFFLARQLKYLCAMLNRQRLFSVRYDLGISNALLDYLDGRPDEQPPAVGAYRQAALLFQHPEDGRFFDQFRRQLPHFMPFFTKTEQRELYYLAINFCTDKIRSGERRYANDLFDLYREGLQKEILLENGELSPWSYKNMIKLGLNLQKFDWVEHIVEHYTQQLNEDFREDAYHFNLADLHYHRGDYDQALLHLHRVEFSDIHYNLGAKAMLLRIYHERGDTEAFLSLAAAFGIFLRRNTVISKNVKASYANFTRILTLIHKYGDRKRLTIQRRIAETKDLYGRGWLLKQLRIDN